MGRALVSGLSPEIKRLRLYQPTRVYWGGSDEITGLKPAVHWPTDDCDIWANSLD